jgi:hypothetical protein
MVRAMVHPQCRILVARTVIDVEEKVQNRAIQTQLDKQADACLAATQRLQRRAAGLVCQDDCHHESNFRGHCKLRN